eukprot:gnl/MRDRNA2_/MRDRNA2_109884_c0_seq1.p1 gnl/MRDRNA2_/MRDRNA2_109884_c0~~gnl/MRDRNA2_/MRDRNA2_109884_c0_seq1.p1  ORF type:complete len:174 (-),score=27.73 gnl/MRDRNA2_/MRDRNA2_109884_c0_seq1:119-640(-)
MSANVIENDTSYQVKVWWQDIAQKIPFEGSIYMLNPWNSGKWFLEPNLLHQVCVQAQEGPMKMKIQCIKATSPEEDGEKLTTKVSEISANLQGPRVEEENDVLKLDPKLGLHFPGMDGGPNLESISQSGEICTSGSISGLFAVPSLMLAFYVFKKLRNLHKSMHEMQKPLMDT